MDPNNINAVGTWASIVGVVVGIAGLVFGWLQATKNRHLLRRTNADIWKMIASAQAIRGELESSEAFKKGDPQMRQVYGRIVEQYRDLLKSAVLDEQNFTEETIIKWRSSGRLLNDWEAAQARKYLDTGRIAGSGPNAGH